MSKLEKLRNTTNALENCYKISTVLRLKAQTLQMGSEQLASITSIKQERIYEIFVDCQASQATVEEIFSIMSALNLNFVTY